MVTDCDGIGLVIEPVALALFDGNPEELALSRTDAVELNDGAPPDGVV